MKFRWFIKYGKDFYLEVAKDTYNFFVKHILISVLSAIAVAIAGYFVGNRMLDVISVDQITINILTVLAGLGVLLLGVFFWNLSFYTPIRILGSNVEAISSLRESIEPLAPPAVRSPFKIEVQEDGNAYFRVEDEKGHFPQGSKKQFLSIRVYSKEEINDVKVYISKIETFSYDNDTLQNHLPICLNFKNVKAGNSVSFSADETQQVDVVSYSSGRKVCRLQLEQFGEGKKPEVFISSSLCCKMQIKIFGKNVSSSQQSFEIYMKEPLDYNYASNSRQRIFMKCVSNEQQGIIDSQRKTIESLEGQQRPKLKVNFKQGGNRYAKEQSGKLNGKNYIFSIELMNLGSGNINNPKVRLFIKSSEDDNFDEQWNLQVNSKDIPKTDEEGEGEFVGVLQYFVHTEHKIGDDVLWMIGSEKDNNNKKARITVQKYDIKIIVSSSNVEPITKHFHFIPRPKNPKFCMEMID